ncbi:MAG: hypothetical protein K0R54_5454 [Clostridiaceae bacterium]|jgi:hypothetical protein|nr:hypothetical protein [Clostridiaceae bacterium]MDF2950506.1 hypothetical protein [Anaerocolumna sp.]
MERLTKITTSGFDNKKVDTEDYSVYELLQMVLGKLAAYEDTNLMPDEVEELQGRIEHLQKFYDYFCELYGTGLDVANWHLNGDLEPFDNFFDSAEESE